MYNSVPGYNIKESPVKLLTIAITHHKVESLKYFLANRSKRSPCLNVILKN